MQLNSYLFSFFVAAADIGGSYFFKVLCKKMTTSEQDEGV